VTVRTLLPGLTLLLVGIGWYEIWHRWDSTRKWKPLEMNVSLTPGHIHTPEFEINTQGKYQIAFAARSGFGHQPERSESLEYQYCLPDLGTSWSLSNQGKVVATGLGQSCDSLGGFNVGDGRYVLDVIVSHDGGRFNSFNPRLAIFEAGGAQEASANQGSLAFWCGIVLITLGAGTVISSALHRLNEKFNSLLIAWPLTQQESHLPPLKRVEGRVAVLATRRPIPAEYLLGDHRSSARYPLTNLSSFSLIAGTLFLCTFVFILILKCLDRAPRMGLPIHLPQLSQLSQEVPKMQPLLVRVELATSKSPRDRPRVYFGSRPIAWVDFDTALQKELSRRPPNWPVYIEADSDMEWGWVVQTIDRIHGLSAEVTLLTSRTP